MQLGFNLWAWTWCNISRPRKSGTLDGGTGGTCGTRCPGTFAFLEPKEFLEPVEPVKRTGFHRFQPFLGFNHATCSTGSRQVPWVQPRYGSTASRQVSWVQPRHWFRRFQTGFLGSKNARFHRFHAFLGFKNATGSTSSRQVPLFQPRHGFNRFQRGSLSSNTPLVPQDSRRVLWVETRNGSTGSRQVPWVQPRH